MWSLRPVAMAGWERLAATISSPTHCPTKSMKKGVEPHFSDFGSGPFRIMRFDPFFSYQE